MQFFLRTAEQCLQASGMQRRVARGARGSLEERCRRALESGEGGLLVGALPFAEHEPDFIYEPITVRLGDALTEIRPQPRGTVAMGHGSFTPFPSEAAYARMVEQALALIGSDINSGPDKVVLSRQLRLNDAGGIDFDQVLDELCRDSAVTAFRVELSETGDHLLMGATPEKLISRRGLRVQSLPLAGSMPRGRNVVQDRARAEQLAGSDKDQREHEITREFVMDSLAPYCRQLGAPEGTMLHATASMWHLGTEIEGTLKSDDMPSAAGLAALLHPTPAVGGFPRDAALAAIAEIEPHQRGFYAGAVGHVDVRGDGEWYVALRCAELEGARLTLHAGAGIVLGSQPEEEVRETAAKFRAMLRAMGVADVAWAGQEAAE